MKPLFITFCLLAILPRAGAGEINVSAAISMKESLTEIAKSYESETHDHIGFNFGASGQLAAQIKNGAPVDLFISAADKQVDDLVKDKAVDVNTRVVLAGNDLVLIVPADAKNAPTDFKSLADASVKRLAVGEPKTVPAGMYAMQTLRNLKLDEALSPRLIYGGNVRQVLDYVRRGEVDAGIVYRTDALEAGDAVRVIATAEASTHDAIRYPAVVTTATTKKDTAVRFLNYLNGEKAQAVFRAKGFTKVEGATATQSTTSPTTQSGM